MLKFIVLTAMLLASAPAATAGTSTTRTGTDVVFTGRSVSSTGQTVPRLGASKGAGTTSLDRGAQRRDDVIEHSICSNC